MMRSRLPLVAAVAATLAAGAVSAARAMPVAPAPDGSAAEVTLVAGGCGPGYHRGFRGFCRPNRFFGRRFLRGRPTYNRGYHRNF